MSDRKIYGVTELTRLIKGTLEDSFGQVWIEGELSNVRRPSSGHLYFTIKDASAQISGVMFRGSQRGLKFDPKDGVITRVYGEVTVYERGGNYQILVKSMEEGGKGPLHARFEALKDKLNKEGLFDEGLKKTIPLLPGHVGVVTSRTGAAVRDILNVVSRRFPNMHIVLAPAKVQGDGAAEEIAAAIDLLNNYEGGLDVMIIGRGGGSLEDLWCFNEEVVARAIVRSQVPVISAVGHEIDFTISDFVADMRAPTPSAAAEMVVGRKEQFEETLNDYSRSIARLLQESITSAKGRLDSICDHYVFREPRNLVKQYLQRVDGLEVRMARVIEGDVASGKKHIETSSVKLAHLLSASCQSATHDVKRLETQLRVLNPLGVLERGYSVTSDKDGNIIRDVKDIKSGKRIVTKVAKGEFESEVVGS